MSTALGPTIKRHKSKQDLETPWEFIRAVENKFGKLVVDLACTRENCKASVGVYYPEYDSLSPMMHWSNWAVTQSRIGGRAWLNPPFDPIRPWVEKCAVESQKGAEILLLSQASIDSSWFWDYVQPFATVYAIDRIKFVGQDHVYPKPLMLSHYCINPSRELQRWRWK